MGYGKSHVITQNMTYPSFMMSNDTWHTQNMSIWAYTEPERKQEARHQYETLLKFHFKWKIEKLSNFICIFRTYLCIF
jgi:hypothetical protein